jgi:glycosyltransferase involved in cell wall biosynthesis
MKSQTLIASPPPKAIVINTAEFGGGAEFVARSVWQGLTDRGWDAWMLLGSKVSSHPKVMTFYESPYIDYRPYSSLPIQVLRSCQKTIAQSLGHDDFHFPFSRRVLELTGSRPDIVFCVNLHGGYFDLREIKVLSSQVPVFAHVADHWWFTGHCAYPKGCERWKTGCGQCPQLKSARRAIPDGTARNWKVKQAIYSQSRLHLTTPTQWMADRIQQSILRPTVQEMRVIPCGVNLATFRPGDQQAARHRWGWPLDEKIILFIAHGGKSNPYKDYATLRQAFELLTQSDGAARWRLVVVGREFPEEWVHGHRVQHLPYVEPAEDRASLLQACDLVTHAVVEEVFGIVLAEALACGRPVVATRAAGIPEVVEDGQQGLLVPPADPRAFASAILQLMGDPLRRQSMSISARERAERYFSLEQMQADYADWFSQAGQVNRISRRRPA